MSTTKTGGNRAKHPARTHGRQRKHGKVRRHGKRGRR